jgi:ketosteroid isomerase-like protein
MLDMRIPQKLIVTAVLLLLFAASTSASEDEIRSRLEQWTADFNNRNKEAACELFSKSLISDFKGQGEAGYETRCALITKALDDPERTYHYGLKVKEIILEGSLAVVRLTWTLTITPGDIVSVEPGLDLFRREEDGRWRIVRYMAFEED